VGFVLDIIILAIVFIIVLLSARKGFVRTAIEVVGFVAAIVLAFTISQPLADITYEKIVEEPMISAAEDNAENLTEKVWDALPGFVADNAETFGISKADVDDTIGSNAQKGSEAAVKQVSATVVKPAATRLLSGIYCSILFIVLMIVVKLLAKVVNKLFSFSFIGTINKALGGVVGSYNFNHVILLSYTVGGYSVVFQILVCRCVSFVRRGDSRIARIMKNIRTLCLLGTAGDS